MIAGLNALDLGRLRMSVGYSRNKKGRPLSPIEVGKLLRQARSEGHSWEECADAIQLDGTGHIRRFQQILELPDDLQHLVSWGSPKGSISFSSAVELVKITDPNDQHIVAYSILKDGLNKNEVRQIAQLRNRSKRPIRECISEIIGMRPTIEKRYVFVGSIIDLAVLKKLAELTQPQRNFLLVSVIEKLNLEGVSGRLGERLFTLVGDEQFNKSMLSTGKENLEAQLQSYISEAVCCASS